MSRKSRHRNNAGKPRAIEHRQYYSDEEQAKREIALWCSVLPWYRRLIDNVRDELHYREHKQDYRPLVGFYC